MGTGIVVIQINNRRCRKTAEATFMHTSSLKRCFYIVVFNWFFEILVHGTNDETVAIRCVRKFSQNAFVTESGRGQTLDLQTKLD